jgi:hypothetical protein
MAKTPVRKAPPHPKPDPGVGAVVRAAKAIPALERLQCNPELPMTAQVSRCTGRCGHCDIHPCQLHTSV